MQTTINPEEFIDLAGMLEEIRIPMLKGLSGRAPYFGEHEALTFGYVIQRCTRKRALSVASEKYPEIYEELLRIGKLICPFDFTSIHLNHNVVCPRHKDKGNIGRSVIVAFGDYEGCDLVVENDDNTTTTYNINCAPLEFDGKNSYHWNTPLIKGHKYSLVYHSK